MERSRIAEKIVNLLKLFFVIVGNKKYFEFLVS